MPHDHHLTEPTAAEPVTDDVRALLPMLEPSRRGFLAASAVASGFALAVQPVEAQTVITTDAAGLEAGMVEIPAPDGVKIPAYRAHPAAGGPFPVVLVVQEIFGVHEHIKDVCRRLAKLGCYAVAPEMFVRQGDPTKAADIPTIQREIVAKVPDAQVMSDLDAVVAFARASGRGHAEKLAITGFCWGGRITWLYAAHNPKVTAGVAWYGRLVGQASPLTPKHPLDLAETIVPPVLGLYGGADAGIPNDTVEMMNEALKKAGKKSMIHLYPDMPHAFHADYRPSYRKEAAEDGWRRLQAWFREAGVL